MKKLFYKFINVPKTKLILILSLILSLSIISQLHIYKDYGKSQKEYSEIIHNTIHYAVYNSYPLTAFSSPYTYIRIDDSLRTLSSKNLNSASVGYIVSTTNTEMELYRYDPYNIIDHNSASYSTYITEPVLGDYKLTCYVYANLPTKFQIFVSQIIHFIFYPLVILLIVGICFCSYSIFYNYKKEPAITSAHFIDKWFYDLALLSGFAIIATILLLYYFYPVSEALNFYSLSILNVVFAIISAAICASIIKHLIITTIRRKIANNLYNSTLIKKTFLPKFLNKIYCSVQKFINKIPNTIKLLVSCVVFIILVFLSYRLISPAFTATILASLFLIYLLYSKFAQKRTISNLEKIHSDPVAAEINKNLLFGKYKKINDSLTGINDGFSDAIDKLIKSERLKSELITNVSHDIKTPLTSIINYVDLLKNEDLAPETRKEYIDVLDRQSNRLKKLIVDLIDASKAATGQVKVDMTKCNIGIMAEQILGEYQDRLNEAGIIPASTEFPKNLFVNADIQCLFRCVDNIMSNICKYALSGTRMYINFLRDGENITITFKNISSAMLDMNPEELMERFVRGDASRSTEGSGLGLSIVSSLMKLMNGELKLEIDGDLFKAHLTLKAAD